MSDNVRTRVLWRKVDLTRGTEARVSKRRTCKKRARRKAKVTRREMGYPTPIDAAFAKEIGRRFELRHDMQPDDLRRGVDMSRQLIILGAPFFITLKAEWRRSGAQRCPRCKGARPTFGESFWRKSVCPRCAMGFVEAERGGEWRFEESWSWWERLIDEPKANNLLATIGLRVALPADLYKWARWGAAAELHRSLVASWETRFVDLPGDTRLHGGYETNVPVLRTRQRNAVPISLLKRVWRTEDDVRRCSHDGGPMVIASFDQFGDCNRLMTWRVCLTCRAHRADSAFHTLEGLIAWMPRW